MRNSASLAAVLFAVSVGFSGPALADDDSCGSQTAVNNAITSAVAWETLVSCSVTLDVAHAHNCVVNACADAGGAVVGTNNDYRFVVSTAAGGPGLDTAWERSVELNNNGGIDDMDSIPVCTTRLVAVPAGSASVTLYWLARKVDAADGDMVVLDASLTAVCTDNL